MGGTGRRFGLVGYVLVDEHVIVMRWIKTICDGRQVYTSTCGEWVIDQMYESTPSGQWQLSHNGYAVNIYEALPSLRSAKELAEGLKEL